MPYQPDGPKRLLVGSTHWQEDINRKIRIPKKTLVHACNMGRQCLPLLDWIGTSKANAQFLFSQSVGPA